MSLSYCAYCGALAAQNLGELWLCDPHGVYLAEEAGGLPSLLEMPPEARRALADAILGRYIREEVQAPNVERADF